jgi:hypothetical protein
MSYLRDASLLEDWIIKHGHPDFNSAVTREGGGSGRHFVFFTAVPSGSKWFQVVPNGTKWFQMVSNGSKWFQMVPNGSKWFQMVPNGPKWSQMVPNGSLGVRFSNLETRDLVD